MIFRIPHLSCSLLLICLYKVDWLHCHDYLVHDKFSTGECRIFGKIQKVKSVSYLAYQVAYTVEPLYSGYIRRINFVLIQGWPYSQGLICTIRVYLGLSEVALIEGCPHIRGGIYEDLVTTGVGEVAAGVGDCVGGSSLICGCVICSVA